MSKNVYQKRKEHKENELNDKDFDNKTIIN